MSELAHHEAAHAVIARALALPVGVVTIESDEKYAGHCEVEWDENDAESVRASILSSLAGGFAAAKYRGVEWDVFQHGTEPANGEDYDLQDFEHQVRIYCRLTGYSKRAAEPLLFQECKALVDEHWPEIERLAGYLISCGTVEYPTYGANPLMSKNGDRTCS